MSVSPHPTKGPGWWQIIYRPNGRKGKQVRIPFLGTIDEAHAWEVELRKQSRLESPSGFPKINEVVPLFMSEYKHSHQASGTARTLRSMRILLPHFGNLLFQAVTPRAVEDYKSKRLAEGVKPTTVQKELAALSSLCRWAAERGYCHPIKIKRFPAKLTKAPIPQAPTQEQVMKLIAGAKWPKAGLIACLYYAGLRSEEARNLAASHIFLDKGLMLITGKGNKQRVVPVARELEMVLKRRLEEIGGKGLLWPGREGETRPDLRLNTECKRLDLPKIRPHDLRHAFGCHATRAGVGLRALQDIMGHSTPVVTELYSRLNAADLIDELKKMDLKTGGEILQSEKS